MKLRILRLEVDVDLSPSVVTTLQVEDRTLFARIVESLLSEQAEYAKEPYLLFDAAGKRLNPKKQMLVLNALPTVPLNDRSLLSKLYRRIRDMTETDADICEMIRELSGKLNEAIGNASGFMIGDYLPTVDWDLEAYLKAFSYLPLSGEDYSLLDNCMRLFELVADVVPETPLVMVNAKSFFNERELEELVDQAVFYGIQVLLLESFGDTHTCKREKLIVVDQHFYVHQ